MTTATADLDEANACHDDDPQHAATLLRRIDPSLLTADRRALLGFLINHVLGEKLGNWPEAHQRQQAVLGAAGEAAGLPLWRHAAVAAHLGADAAQAESALMALASGTHAPRDAAQALVQLAAASLLVPGLSADAAGLRANEALAALAAVHARSVPTLDAGFAAAANNLASHLAERPLGDLRSPALQAALRDSATQAQRFWQRAGNWVQQERANYLLALSANALGDWAAGAQAARAGLALLDTHDVDHAESVDRAFIEQELAVALHGAGDTAARAADERAQAFAGAFNDAGLTSWFNDRATRGAALLAHHRR